LIASLTHATASSVTADTVTIDAGIYYRYFRITAASVGVDTIRATATGHNATAAPIAVGLGRIDGLGNWTGTLATDSVQVILYPRAPDGSGRNVAANTTFNLAVDANLQFWSGGANSAQITSVVVPANGTQVAFWLKRTGAGAANVSISATGYTTYNSVVTVNPP
jgi:hypothetical protein